MSMAGSEYQLCRMSAQLCGMSFRRCSISLWQCRMPTTFWGASMGSERCKMFAGGCVLPGGRATLCHVHMQLPIFHITVPTWHVSTGKCSCAVIHLKILALICVGAARSLQGASSKMSAVPVPVEVAVLVIGCPHCGAEIPVRIGAECLPSALPAGPSTSEPPPMTPGGPAPESPPPSSEGAAPPRSRSHGRT